MQIISLANRNDFVESVNLEGTMYKLHFAWNPKAGWSVDMRTAQNVDIIRSIAVVPNFPLLNMYRRHDSLPPGELMAVINEKNAQQIGRDDFMTGLANFVYIPLEELINAVETAV